MYALLKVTLKYLRYFITASNGKGHGVHSPFVFGFIKNVLNDKSHYAEYDQVETLRKQLLTNETVLTIQDFGAGSSIHKGNERKVNSIARSSLKPAKFGQLIFRLIKYYKPATVIELGTSLGVTSAYLALANTGAQVITFEGAGEVATVAQKNFDSIALQNIEIVTGNFDNTLEGKLRSLKTVDLAFIDGNHRKEPTLRYFDLLLQKATPNSIFIFDDVHWSQPMEEAWKHIISHPKVTLSIDLFFIGLVFFRTEQKKVQHFSVRF